MLGGLGNDIYIVDNAEDVVIENYNEGNDTVQTGINYYLADNVENMTLTGIENSNAIGNILDNVITGNNSDNIINGMQGADHMTGLGGNDTYYVDNAADTVIENISEGIDKVISSISYTLSDNVENLELTGSEALNAVGNILNNYIKGNISSNLIDGAEGSDTMAGGAGNDTYIVDNTLDNIVENLNSGIDTVKTSVDFMLSDTIKFMII